MQMVTLPTLVSHIKSTGERISGILTSKAKNGMIKFQGLKTKPRM